MKKIYLLSAVFLGSSLLFATESMAWHFEIGNSGQTSTEWENIGQTLDFGRTVEAESGYQYTVTGYDSTTYEDGTTFYNFQFNDGFEEMNDDGMWAIDGAGGGYSSANLDVYYRVVSDWGTGTQMPVQLSSETSFQAAGFGDESYSSSAIGDLIHNNSEASPWIDNHVSFSIETDAYGGDAIGQGDDFWFSNDSFSETFNDPADAVPGIGYGLSASLEAESQIQNLELSFGLFDIAAQDLIDAGFVDNQGNADPDAVIGEYVLGDASASAELTFSMTTPEEDNPPGYVPPTVDFDEDNPVHVGDVDAMTPTDPDAESWTFENFWVQEEGLYAFDPDYAVGYVYTLDQNSIANGFAFDELMLFLGSDTDDTFEVLWDGNTQELTAGNGVGSNPFDFNGDFVTSFTVSGIGWENLINPADPNGFPTMIGFNNPGQPVFTMAPITEYHAGQQPVPEPATMLLFGTGLTGLLAFRKKTFFKK